MLRRTTMTRKHPGTDAAVLIMAISSPLPVMLGLDPSIGNSAHHRKNGSTATNTGGK
jgi:hypothetical protein